MYRRVEFFKMGYMLKLAELQESFRGVTSKPRVTRDKNGKGAMIRLPCKYEKVERDGNYIVNINITHQMRARPDMEYEQVTDSLALVFALKKQFLAVMGRHAIGDALDEVSKILHPSMQDEVFHHVRFAPDAVIEAIKKLRADDGRSWCHRFGSKFEARMYKGKTELDFSKGEGVCILDDREAVDAISNATNLAPEFRFYKCPKLSTVEYDQPKSMRFNTKKGVVSISVRQEFDDLYQFTTAFLIKSLGMHVV